MSTLLAGLTALALAAGPARADEIVLRATARVGPGADATLADIAILTGPHAEELGSAVIAPAAELGGGWLRVDLDRVKAALEKRGKVPWGVISLRGSACSVGTTGAQAASKPTTIEPSGPAGEPALGLGTGTVRGCIAARIAGTLGVAPAGLRLAFDERDADILSMPAAGRIVEVRITGTSDRVPVRVTIFEGETQLASRSLGVGALVLREVAAAKTAIRRGEAIGADDVSSEERWVGPSLASVAPDDAVGSAAKAPMDAGHIITAGDVQGAAVIARGDLVTVSSIAGGVVVRTTARARGSARCGDLFDLETLDPDRKRRRTFTARASGRGLAVVAAGSDEPALEEQP